MLCMEIESAECVDEMSDAEHGLVQGEESMLEVDETCDSICSRWRRTWRPVAHTSRPRQERSELRSGPKTCVRSAEWSSSWCVGKGSST